MKKRNDDTHVRLRPNVFRIIMGVIAGYFVPLFSLFLALLALQLQPTGVFNGAWMFWIMAIALYLVAITAPFYFYGWFHKSLWLFVGSPDWYARWFGRIFGGIGYVLQPIVLLFYGHNKKWLYFLLVGVPSLLIGGVSLIIYLNVLQLNFQFEVMSTTVIFSEKSTHGLYVAIAFLLNAFLALCTKRCKNCGAMMTKVVHNLNGKTHSKYARYDGVDFYGDNLEVGKYYVCTNCRTVKKGIGFSVQTDGYVD